MLEVHAILHRQRCYENMTEKTGTLSDAYVHVAWGLKQLLNRIPYEDAVSIRIQLVGHYGKTGYYRFYRGERGLMPKDQAYIRQLFRNKGIKEEPTYQRYTEEYIW